MKEFKKGEWIYSPGCCVGPVKIEEFASNLVAYVQDIRGNKTNIEISDVFKPVRGAHMIDALIDVAGEYMHIEDAFVEFNVEEVTLKINGFEVFRDGDAIWISKD